METKVGRPLKEVYIFDQNGNRTYCETVKEAAAIVGVHVWKIYYACKTGEEVNGYRCSYEQEIYTKHVAFYF